jgi:hypothetical protein
VGVIADTRQVVQDLVSPDLTRIDEAVQSLKKALPEMESRLLAAIKASEDHLSLKIEFAMLQRKYKDLQRKQVQNAQ